MIRFAELGKRLPCRRASNEVGVASLAVALAYGLYAAAIVPVVEPTSICEATVERYGRTASQRRSQRRSASRTGAAV